MLHAQFISLNKIKSVETPQNLKSNLLAVLFACASSKKEKMRFIWNGADCLCFRDCAKALNCTSYNLKGFKPKCQTMHTSYLSCCLLSSAYFSSLDHLWLYAIVPSIMWGFFLYYFVDHNVTSFFGFFSEKNCW